MDWEALRGQFHLPKGVIYLDGNSLGPMPRAVPVRVGDVMEEWADLLIRGWNEGDGGGGWMGWPGRIGDRIARLIGAAEGTVTVGDTLSIRVYQAVASALHLAGPERAVVLSDEGNFPSDLYMAEGLVSTLGRGELRVVPPEAVMDALTEEVSVLMLTQVDYRTGRMHDMAALDRAAKAKGIVTVWDLAHSAGAHEVDVTAAGADFAVGCTYKYLNAGPGAPAFIYVRPELQDRVRPALAGWLGHARPFAFELGYAPGEGIDRMRVGTPPVLQLAALDAALDVWDAVDMGQLRARSLALSGRFASAVAARCPTLTPALAPDVPRGSQVSLRHPEGYAIVQALIARGVIGDFRAPDILRFGFTPLFLSEADVDAAVAHLAEVMEREEYAQDRFRTRRAVT
ncbi:kynureninase [Jannaschia seohaensis]|uniref:Kynureninase n=2 Tax=Jannaschia seohaensis TaxID=475081 RepID=A0A2Y9ARQ7_9RHOB|nr:kynureninase [Jannaschia seohaensis]PWJ18230.1 kynureninase [Jannaschia seohaensis]SSA46755.1 kynureninase [Jannaschia seohaensis]